jgi:exosome complex component RRP41
LVLDLNYVEDSAGGPDLPVAILAGSGKISLLQMDSKLPIDMFEKVVSLAVEGCKAIHKVLLNEVQNYTYDVLQAKGTVAGGIPLQVT